MSDQSLELVNFVTTELRRVADSSRAPAMAAYMKTQQAFYGVPTPSRAAIFREMRNRFAPSDQKSYARNVLALWKLAHREEQYAAIAYARYHAVFVTPEAMPLYERMIRAGAWWDFVDEIAAHLSGAVLLKYRAESRATIERWIDDSHMWIRRAALLAHLRHKSDTDAEQLFDHCLRRSQETEFFIRKAIGWALREYSKTDPSAVKSFLAKNRKRLSNLSYAEGSKRIKM